MAQVSSFVVCCNLENRIWTHSKTLVYTYIYVYHHLCTINFIEIDAGNHAVMPWPTSTLQRWQVGLSFGFTQALLAENDNSSPKRVVDPL